MKKLFIATTLASIAGIQIAHAADTAAVTERLNEYQTQGAADFSAERGDQMWHQNFPDPEGGPAQNCTTCHGTDLNLQGKHARTGKIIEPMARSVNPERLTDGKKIEKWFLRNCKSVLNRECTPQEKGDFLRYLSSK
ncbi:MAG: DUF1924 domain-containing protein [Zetaproteobacteria bacterium]|nr:DUF1924 domain-containing protein [Zetaproteobacteria bacterium]